MTHRTPLRIDWICGLLILATTPAFGQSDKRGRFFETKIRPILIDHCYDCHGGDPDSIQNDLDLTTASGLRRGGQSGRVVIPGEPRKSLLILAIQHSEPDLQMPKDRLPRTVIRDFEKWVNDGAFDPRKDTNVDTPKRTLATNASDYDFTDGRKHWAYQPMRRPSIPETISRDGPVSPIDRFVFARQQRNGIKRSAPANKRQLLRRVTFNLTGLPPTENEIRDFLTDTSANAFEKVVDRLLDSNSYGEHWGRHWLDVVRYADSNGGDDNIGYPNSFQFRDYVIRSFNTDKPFNRFVQEQIAGDLLDDFRDDTERFDALTGTGFWMLGSKVLDLKDHEARSLSIIAEQLDVMGTAFMGQHIGCARCHDHKFDPIPTRDYYALAGILKSSRIMDATDTRGHFMIQRPLATQTELAAYEKARAAIEVVENELEDTAVAASEKVRRQRIADFARYLPLADLLRRDIKDAEWIKRNAKEKELDWRVLERVRDFLHPDRVDMAHIFAVWNAFADEFHTAEKPTPQRLRPIEEALTARSKAEPETVSVLTLQTLQPAPPESLAQLAKRYARLFGRLDASLDDHLDFYTLRSELDLLLHKFGDLQAGSREALKEIAELTTQTKSLLPPLQRVESRLEAIAGSGILKNVAAVRTGLQSSLELQAEARTKLSGGKTEEAQDQIRHGLETLRKAQERIKRLPEDREERLQVLVDVVRFENISRLLRSPHDSPFVRDAEDEEKLYDVKTLSRLRELREQLSRLLDRSPPTPAWAMAIRESEELVDLPVHYRGSHLTKAEKPVARGFLRVTDHIFPAKGLAGDQSGRLELARWLTHPHHPLTSRLIVNRIWQWNFGNGIVETSNNFGTRGVEPSHPALLDYLATQFIELGWSVKKLNREILLSQTWRLSTDAHASEADKDPENRFLWRMNRRRLEAEAIRDAMLAVSGRLDPRMSGRVDEYNPGRGERDRFVFREGAAWFELKEKLFIAPRRSVYLPVIRNALNPMLAIFDYTDASAPVGKRNATVVATQALLMMNSAFVVTQAEAFAERILQEVSTDETARINSAFVRAYGRPPRASEVADAAAFLTAMEVRTKPKFAWARFCHVLFANSEFIYVE